MADVFAPQPVKTKVAGDVVVNVNSGQTIGLSSGAAVVGKFGIDQTTPGTTNAVSVSNASLPVTGTFFQTTQPVSLATNTPVIAAGANIIGSLTANQTVNFSQVNGVVVTTGAGASSTGTQRVILATDQGTIPVSSGLSFTTVDSGHLTSASLAAGATVTLDGAQIASGVGKLFEATVASSVALKAQLGTFDGTTFVVKRTFFIPANAVFEYSPTRYDAITFPTGTTAKFRWSITNNDNTNAADVYASITHAI